MEVVGFDSIKEFYASDEDSRNSWMELETKQHHEQVWKKLFVVVGRVEGMRVSSEFGTSSGLLEDSLHKVESSAAMPVPQLLERRNTRNHGIITNTILQPYPLGDHTREIQ
nr:hypothetical protein [Tanacetum cinerariifolium]